MKTYLRIKIKTLAAESRLIKAEKARWIKKARCGRLKASPPKTPATMHVRLHEHRMNIVRPEARDSLLALGFLRGLRYEQMEAKRYTNPNFENVFRMVRDFYDPSYGLATNEDLVTHFKTWQDSVPPKAVKGQRVKGDQPRVHRTKEDWLSQQKQ